MESLRYSIFDPTGNITALVESVIEVDRQPAVAAELMERHAEIEQVGFVRYPAEGAVQLSLRMAGGEFCGNASMSAAALYLLRRGNQSEAGVTLRVSGARKPLEARLRRETEDRFSAGLRMPGALAIEDVTLTDGALTAPLPLVRMEGIAHLIVEPGSAFFALLNAPERAERAVRRWASELKVEALGLMFLEAEGMDERLTPLVFVPVSDTLFWENSCASGSAAVGMYLARKTGAIVAMTLREPGGSLRVESNSKTGETWLYGKTRLIGSFH